MKNIKKKMKTLREIVNDFKNTIVVFKNELKNTTVVITNESRRKYAKAIKELIPTVNGNEELAEIAKTYMTNAAKLLEDDSQKLDKFSYLVLADFILEVAVFIENPKPRLINAQNGYYYDKVRKGKISEFFGGRNYKLVRLASGKIAIYKLKDPDRNIKDC